MSDVVAVAAVMLEVVIMVTAAIAANLHGALSVCRASFKAFWVGYWIYPVTALWCVTVFLIF